jgi:hypothetical protein
MKHADAAASASDTQLDDWKRQWAKAMGTIRLAADASEEEATARLQQLSDLTQAHGTLDRSRNEQRNARHPDRRLRIPSGQIWQRVRGERLPADGRSP